MCAFIALILLTFIAFVLNPILGIFVLLIGGFVAFVFTTSDNYRHNNIAPGETEEKRKCRYCAELIQREAIVCPHCQRKLP